MSDRLAELRRQRALVQEHLAWLDREVAALETSPSSATPSAPVPLSAHPPRIATAPARTPSLSLSSSPDAPLPTFSATPSLAPSLSPDALLEEYRVEPSAVKSDVRKGCFLYFAAAFAVLGLTIVLLWLAFRR